MLLLKKKKGVYRVIFVKEGRYKYFSFFLIIFLYFFIIYETKKINNKDIGQVINLIIISLMLKRLSNFYTLIVNVSSMLKYLTLSKYSSEKPLSKQQIPPKTNDIFVKERYEVCKASKRVSRVCWTFCTLRIAYGNRY